MPIWFAYTLIVLLVITSVLLTMLILLHRGKGGGLSSMFGGGVSSSLAGSSVAEKNLDRYTVLVSIVWFACIVGLGLWLRLQINSGVLSDSIRSYNLRAVRLTDRAQVCFSATSPTARLRRWSPPTTGASRAQWQRHPWFTNRCGTGCAPPNGTSRPPAARSPTGAATTTSPRSGWRRTPRSRPSGTARAAGCPPVRTRRTRPDAPAPSPTRPTWRT